MGIPTFFRELFAKYRDTCYGMRPGAVLCDYLFFDYNAMVYTAYYAIQSKVEGKGLPKREIEREVIDELIRSTAHIVNDVVKPKKLLYFALDGPAPRMKMNQQRSRRYRAVITKEYQLEQRRKFGMIEDVPWDASSNISPGTEFMETLARRLLDAVKRKVFVGDRGSKLQTIVSHSNVPGEGEHKFLPIIRNLRKHPVERESSVCIVSKDADVFILAMATHKSNISVMRSVADEKDHDLQEAFTGSEYFGVDMDKCRRYFGATLTRNMLGGPATQRGGNKGRNGSGGGAGAGTAPESPSNDIINDYNFLTFLTGNDFVISLPFFKIRRGGLERLTTIYSEIRPSQTSNLILYDPETRPNPEINMPFFKAILDVLVTRENDLLRNQQKELFLMLNGKRGMPRPEKEAGLTPYEIATSRFEHTEVCVPVHPLHQEYKNEFKKIDYRQDPAVYKAQYYNHFVGIDATGPGGAEEYQRVVDHMCHNYLESLVFNLRYYLVGCPSWRWSYNYRVVPFISDVVSYIEKTGLDINSITFDLGRPYTPFEQLLLILPPQMEHIIPRALRPIMNDVNHGCVHYYPSRVRLDVVDGLKVIYSETITPEIDESILLGKFAELEGGMTQEERARNVITDKAVYVKNV